MASVCPPNRFERGLNLPSASTTPLQNRIPPPIREDWVQVELWLDLPNWPTLQQHLRTQEDRRHRFPGGRLPITLGDLDLTLVPKPEDGKFTARYHLAHQDFRLALREHPVIPDSNTGNAQVILYRGLRQLPGGWEKFTKYLDAMGATLRRTRITRIDLAADLLAVPFAHFHAAYTEGRFVSRAKHHAQENYGNASTPNALSFFTTKDRRLSIYDKLNELRDNKGKRDLATEARELWGTLPDHATRVEYQLHRGYLGKQGVTTIDDWLAHRGDIFRDLVRNWVRFTAQIPTPGNQRRTPLDPEWARLDKAVDAWASGLAPVPVPERDPHLQPKIAPDQLAKQSLSCKYRMAVTDHSIRSPLEPLADELRQMTTPDARKRLQAARQAAGLPPEADEVIDTRERQAVLEILGMAQEGLAALDARRWTESPRDARETDQPL